MRCVICAMFGRKSDDIFHKKHPTTDYLISNFRNSFHNTHSLPIDTDRTLRALLEAFKSHVSFHHFRDETRIRGGCGCNVISNLLNTTLSTYT